jgi:hypothetical protein
MRWESLAMMVFPICIEWFSRWVKLRSILLSATEHDVRIRRRRAASDLAHHRYQLVVVSVRDG